MHVFQVSRLKILSFPASSMQAVNDPWSGCGSFGLASDSFFEWFIYLANLIMVATGQEMVREKKFFKVREMSGNFILG